MGEKVTLEEVFLHKCYLYEYLKLKVLVVQSSLTLCNSMDHSPAREFFSHELPFSSPGCFPNPGIECGSQILHCSLVFGT